MTNNLAAAAAAAGAARGAAVADFLLLIALGLLFRMASYISLIVGAAWGAARSVVRGRPAESAAATGAGDKKKTGKKVEKGEPRTIPEYLKTIYIEPRDIALVVAALKDTYGATKFESLKDTYKGDIIKIAIACDSSSTSSGQDLALLRFHLSRRRFAPASSPAGAQGAAFSKNDVSFWTAVGVAVGAAVASATRMAAAAAAAGAARGAEVADFLLLIALGLLFRMASYISSIVGAAWGAARSVVRGRPAESAAAAGAGDKKKKGKKGKKGKPRTISEHLSTFDIESRDVALVVAAIKDTYGATKLESLKYLNEGDIIKIAIACDLKGVSTLELLMAWRIGTVDSSPTSVLTLFPEDMASQTNPGPGFKNPDL